MAYQKQWRDREASRRSGLGENAVENDGRMCVRLPPQLQGGSEMLAVIHHEARMSFTRRFVATLLPVQAPGCGPRIGQLVDMVAVCHVPCHSSPEKCGFDTEMRGKLGTEMFIGV